MIMTKGDINKNPESGFTKVISTGKLDFPVNVAQFPGPAFFTEHPWWLFLTSSIWFTCYSECQACKSPIRFFFTNNGCALETCFIDKRFWTLLFSVSKIQPLLPKTAFLGYLNICHQCRSSFLVAHSVVSFSLTPKCKYNENHGTPQTIITI